MTVRIDPDLAVPVIGEIAVRGDELDREFWVGLADGDLRLQHCDGCDRWTWPVEPACSRCRGPLRWTSVAAAGQVFSWTRTWHAFDDDVRDHLPYVVVLVELRDAPGVRLLGILVGGEPTIGRPVHGVVQPPSAQSSGLAVLRWEAA